MPYLITCDIGTTSTKTSAYDLKGEVLFTTSSGYPMNHPEPDWAEQDPDRIFEAVVETIGIAVEELGADVAGIVFSAAMHSVMAVDEYFKPLTPLMLWADARSKTQSDLYRASAEGRRIYEITGTPVHPMSPLFRLMWFREHRPRLLQSASAWIGIKEYVVCRLTGELILDYSVASATGLFDSVKKEWSEELLDLAGIRSVQLAKPVSPYYQAFYKERNSLELATATPVIAGGSDGCLANLGGGSEAGDVTVTIGTSAAARVTTSRRLIDPEMRVFCYVLDEQTYVVGGASNNGAVALQWVKDTFFKNHTYDEVLQEGLALQPGADGLRFLPYLMGERAPLWNSKARGGFMGLQITHSAGHFVRAVLEGVIFNIYTIIKSVDPERKAKAIFASGGFTHSEGWVRILADVSGLPVAIRPESDATSFGAAIIGLRSLGILPLSGMPSIESTARLIQPVEANRAVYREAFDNFERWQRIVSEMYK